MSELPTLAPGRYNRPMPSHHLPRRSASVRAQIGMILVLLMSFSLGLFRVTATPPWRTADEPGHYEYILYIAETRSLPAPDALDLSLRQAISGVYTGVDCSSDVPGSIAGCLGFHQFDEPPLYYLIQALNQTVTDRDHILQGMRVARVTSLFMMLIALAISYHCGRLLAPKHPVLALSAPAFLAVLPGYLNVMTGINNDVLAGVSGAALLWITLALIRSGVTVQRLVLLGATCLLALFSKVTAALLVPVAFIGLWLPLTRRLPALALAPFAAGALALPFLFTLNAPANWQSGGLPESRRASDSAPLGDQVFELREGGRLTYTLDPASVGALAGKTVTLGAWMRAPGDSALVFTPGVFTTTGPVSPLSDPALLSDSWAFYAWTYPIPADTSALALEFAPEAGVIQVDGVALVEGDFQAGDPPQWDGPGEKQGTWGGKPIDNLVRNPSAEAGMLLLKPFLNERLPFGLNSRLEAAQNWHFTGRYYRAGISGLLLSFWGLFDWGAISFRFPLTLLFGLLSLLSMGGLALYGLRFQAGRSGRLAWLVVLLFGIGSLAFAVIRIDPPSGLGVFPFLGSIRYLTPVMPGLALLFMLGLSRWLPSKWRPFALAFLIAFLHIAHLLATFRVQLPYWGIG